MSYAGNLVALMSTFFFQQLKRTLGRPAAGDPGRAVIVASSF